MDMPDNFRIERALWSVNRTELVGVRRTVFIEEQGVSEAIELDALDVQSHHVIGRIDGQAVATGRLLPDGHIGRVAVLSRCRGQGMGTLIMGALMQWAGELGMREVALSSQTHAVPFYEKLGFLPVGPEFIEADIPHQAMTRQLLADQA
jgi:predicted GNAT family N-acyltransferase